MGKALGSSVNLPNKYKFFLQNAQNLDFKLVYKKLNVILFLELKMSIWKIIIATLLDTFTRKNRIDKFNN